MNGDNQISKHELYDFLLTHDEDVGETRHSIGKRQKKPKTLKKLASELLEEEHGIIAPELELVRNTSDYLYRSSLN